MTTSAPLASRQSRISSSVAYFPVPTKSRLRTVCVPIESGGRSAAVAASDPPPTRVTISSTSPGADPGLRVPGPRDQVAIDLDGHVLGLQLQIAQQLGDRHRLGHLAPLAVEHDLQGRSHRRRSTGGHSGYQELSPRRPVTSVKPFPSKGHWKMSRVDTVPFFLVHPMIIVSREERQGQVRASYLMAARMEAGTCLRGPKGDGSRSAAHNAIGLAGESPVVGIDCLPT